MSVHSGLRWLTRTLGSRLAVTSLYFEKLLVKVSPSVSPAQRRKYEALRTRLQGVALRVPEVEAKPTGGDDPTAVTA